MRVGIGQRGCAIISLHFCLAEREGSNSCGITALHCWRRPFNSALVLARVNGQRERKAGGRPEAKGGTTT